MVEHPLNGLLLTMFIHLKARHEVIKHEVENEHAPRVKSSSNNGWLSIARVGRAGAAQASNKYVHARSLRP